MKSFVFALLIALSFSFNSFSCSCPTPDKLTEGELNKAVKVFIGKVVSVEKKFSSYEIIATFVVTEQIFGKEQQMEYKVTTSADGGMCGLDFSIGEEWYVFADDSDGNLAAYLCGRSVQLSDRVYPKEMLTNKELWNIRRAQKDQRKRVRQDKRLIKEFLRKNQV